MRARPRPHAPPDRTWARALVAAGVAACLLVGRATGRADEGTPVPSEPSADAPAPMPAEPPTDAPAPVPSAAADIWQRIDLSTLWFLHVGGGEVEGRATGQFSVSRGYLTAQVRPADWFQARITLDAHQNDSGDFVVRLKYLHGKFVWPIETVVVSQPYVEFGIVHMPWLDFEEHVNRYRAQGTMFSERNGLFNSADVGVTVGVLLGEPLDATYRKTVGKAYPGRYGSLALGVYNGGGYHASEQNEDKVFEARASVRPLGFVWPNLQLSYFLVFGKGNTAAEPAWVNHVAMASIEHEFFVLTGTFVTGRGDQKGQQVDALGRPLGLLGWSVFAEGRIRPADVTLFARYDWFDWQRGGADPPSSRIIGGVAYWFLGPNALLLDADVHLDHTPDWPLDWIVRLTLRAAFP